MAITTAEPASAAVFDSDLKAYKTRIKNTPVNSDATQYATHFFEATQNFRDHFKCNKREQKKIIKILLMPLWIKRWWCIISTGTASRGWMTANNLRMWIHNHTSITTLTHWNRSQIGKIFTYSMNLKSSVAVQWRKQYYARNRQQKKTKMANVARK